MLNSKSTIGVGAAVLALLGTSGDAAADRASGQVAREAASLTSALGSASFPVLQRASAATPDAVVQSVSTALCGGTCVGATSSSTSGESRVTVGSWTLRATGDGSLVQYFDSAVAGRKSSLGAPTKMDAATLERLARAFIGDKLKAIVNLGVGETLDVVGVDYRTEEGQSAAGGPIDSRVVANRIVFARSINGVPVVGNGSKVTVTLANDGSVESFRSDWPTYTVLARHHATIDPGTLLTRVQAVIVQRNGVSHSTAQANAAIAAHPTAYPVPLTDNALLDDMTCGYFDAGQAQQNAVVQTGCTYHANGQVRVGTGLVRAGFGGAVPAGVDIESDPRWAEAAFLTSQGTLSSQSAPPGVAPKP